MVKKTKVLAVCEIPKNKEVFICVEFHGKFYKGYLPEKDPEEVLE